MLGSLLVWCYAGTVVLPSASSGDTAKVLYVTTGRTVSSDQPAGEIRRTSDQYVQIDAAPGKVQLHRWSNATWDPKTCNYRPVGQLRRQWS